MLPDDLFATVEGFLSLPEAELLHALACAVPSGSNIVELGSYKARSTVALALGAKEAGAVVWAVDHHPTYEAGGTQYSMADNQAYYANIAKYGVGDVVRTINLHSSWLAALWGEKIALLFIDGNHDYEQVKGDWLNWSYCADTVAIHDTAGHHPDVSKLLDEVLASGVWEVVQFVDSLSILKRVANG